MTKPSDRPGWKGAAAVAKFTFLQRMMVQSYCTEEEAKELMKVLVSSSGDRRTGETWDEFIAAINTELSGLHFELRKIQPPGDNRWYLGLVNRIQDESSKQGSKARPAEREYIRAVLQHIASDEGADECGVARVPSSVLINLRYQNQDAAGTQITKTEKEKMLKTMVEEGWLANAGAGHYKLGPRTYLELSDYLMTSGGMSEKTIEAWKKVLD